jgi:hypothetical protein
MMAKSHDRILCIIYTSPYYRHVSEAEVREVGGGTPIEPSVAFHEIQVQYVESYVVVHQSISCSNLPRPRRIRDEPML